MSFARRPSLDWQLRSRSLALGSRTCVMGILNITPDSFSDGGLHLSPQAALRHALTLLDEGADILDLGGESTRPRSTPLSPEEEQSRILPVLEAILKARPDAILSVDTYHASTARLAVESGAQIVNDVSGHTWDPDMAAMCAYLGPGLVLMHTRGHPQEWQNLPPLPTTAIVPVVLAGLSESLAAARAAGTPAAHIVLDPGLGFGKIGDENYVLLAQLQQLQQLGHPLLVGASRKGFLGRTLAPFYNGEPAPTEDRLHATLAANTAAILAGAHILRVHDVRAAVEAAAVADTILAAHRASQGTTPSLSRKISSTPQ